MTPGAPRSHRSGRGTSTPSSPRPARLASAVPAPPAGDTVEGMRAIEYSVTGDPDVLTPGRAAGARSRAGRGAGPHPPLRRQPDRLEVASRRATPGAAVDPPQVPNQDGSGVVDAVGQGVEAALVGLRVWIWEAAHLRPAGGTAQEYAVVPARHVVLLPDVASFDLGASLGVPFLTAHRCLTVTEDGPTRLGPGTLEGRTVLVAGGAGAVGNAAIQLARWSDATVITTVSSPEKGHLAARAGADHVIDYTAAGRGRRGARHRPARREHDRRGLPGGERRARRGGARPARLGGGLRQQRRQRDGAARAALDGAERPLAVRPGLQRARTAWRARALEDVAAAVLDGAVRVGDEAGLPLHHYPLEQAAEAHAAVEGGAVGKVLIDVRP